MLIYNPFQPRIPLVIHNTKRSDFTYTFLLIHKDLTNQSLYLLTAEMNDLFRHTYLDQIIKPQHE